MWNLGLLVLEQKLDVKNMLSLNLYYCYSDANIKGINVKVGKETKRKGAIYYSGGELGQTFHTDRAWHGKLTI